MVSFCSVVFRKGFGHCFFDDVVQVDVSKASGRSTFKFGMEIPSAHQFIQFGIDGNFCVVRLGY